MIPNQIASYLDLHGARWWSRRHLPTRTAQELASELHVTGFRVAKSVALEIDGRIWLAVLPATDRIDFERLAIELDAISIRLVGEIEMQKFFPGCEVGAEPPFGGLFGIPIVVDRSLSFEDPIVFNGGSHSEAIEMSFQELSLLEHPRLASFGVPSWREDFS